jgi:ubiquinol-cytochrome c reductase cytochrome b subunit
MRESLIGYIFRYIHCNGASFIFMLAYIHILRSLIYNSYIFIYLCWISGLIMYCMLMIIGFIGYILPFGQMSFWGATVIFNIISIIPYLTDWIYGCNILSIFSLIRLFIIHFIFSILLFIPLIIHILYLHYMISNNPMGMINIFVINFYPYLIIKDIFTLFIILILFIIIIINNLSNPDNGFIMNGLITPIHILPEWYFLLYYGILKAIPNKYCGVYNLFIIILLLSLYVEVYNYNITFYSYYNMYIAILLYTIINIALYASYMPYILYIYNILVSYIILICIMYSITYNVYSNSIYNYNFNMLVYNITY